MTRRKLLSFPYTYAIIATLLSLYKNNCNGFICVGMSIRPSLGFTFIHSTRHQRIHHQNRQSPFSKSRSCLYLSDGGRGDFFDELPKVSSERKDSDRSQVFPSSSDPEAHIPRLNIVTLVGRIGSTPAPKYFDDGKVVVSLSLAVKRKYHPLERKVKNIKNGEEETDWFNLEIWGRDAEYATKYVTKGARVGITGSLACDGWVDRTTGEKRHKFKIVVKHLDILESKAEADLRSGGRKPYYDSDDEDNGPYSAGSGSFFDS